MAINKQKFIELAEIKREIKGLTLKMKTLAVEVTEEMTRNGLEEIQSDDGKFVLIKMRRWTSYPDAIVQVMADLEVSKREAEAKGHATYEENQILKYYEAK